MKKLFFILLLAIIVFNSKGQYIELDHYNNQSNFAKDRTETKETGPEIFQNGFIDFLSNGNLQASARVLKLYIGEPEGFHLPLLIYSGVAGQAFGQGKENSPTISNLLNPVGGIINFSFYRSSDIMPSDISYTKIKFACQLGGRMVNAEDTITKKNLTFFNGFANTGFLFQTSAWEPSSDSRGIFWLQGKLMASYSSKTTMESFFGDYNGDLLYGFMFDGGIEIDGLINLKLSYYKHLNNTIAGIIEKPVFKVSLDYNLKKQ